MRPNLRFAFQTLLLAVIGVGAQATAATTEDALYRFSYEFESGGMLQGFFEGRPYDDSSPPPFQDTIIVLPSAAMATYADPSGLTFTWDTRLPTHTTSQVSLISPGEFAFVSTGGLKMDIVFAAGDRLLSLENGIQNQGLLNNASTENLLFNDISESFIPASWSLERVPEPSSLLLTYNLAMFFALQRFR